MEGTHIVIYASFLMDRNGIFMYKSGSTKA